MSFLLDTNVVSEWARPRPNLGVMSWLAEVDEDRTFLSVVTLAELRDGVCRVAPSARRNRLEGWLNDDLPARFNGRIIAVDHRVAMEWGDVVAERRRGGKPIGAMDAFIAATARVHGLQVVTCNTGDFASSVAKVINPWVSN